MVFSIFKDSLCIFFDVVYLNWNPSMFSHTYSIVGSWNAGSGPIKDMYNVSYDHTINVSSGVTVDYFDQIIFKDGSKSAI